MGWRGVLLAVAAGVSVANVYYAQPLLDRIGADLAVRPGALGLVTTVTQAGYLLGLVLIVPLGDLLSRRRMIVWQALAACAGLVVVGLARDAVVFFAACAVVGLASVVVQVIVAYAAALSIPGQRGSAVGMVTSGVVTGILMARTASGLIADRLGWRTVYFLSAALMLAMAVMLGRLLPPDRIPKERVPYLALVSSVVTLAARDRTFRVRALLGFLMFGGFGAVWGSIALPLAAAPWHLSGGRIGLFGVAGAAGAVSTASRPRPRPVGNRNLAGPAHRVLGGDAGGPVLPGAARRRRRRPRLRRTGTPRDQPAPNRRGQPRRQQPNHRRLHGLLLRRHWFRRGCRHQPVRGGRLGGRQRPGRRTVRAGPARVGHRPAMARSPSNVNNRPAVNQQEGAPVTMYYRKATIAGLEIFYREAGSPAKPAFLLLHGFPASSCMFRQLIELLADKFHVIAPDYPGFGHSEASPPSRFSYTFDHLTDIVEGFTEHLGLGRYGVYMQDFGGPVGFRLAARHPERVAFLVIQNANAYEDALPDSFWAPLRAMWADPSAASREAICSGGMSDAALEWTTSTESRIPPASIPTAGSCKARCLGGRATGTPCSTCSTTTGRTPASTPGGRSTFATGSRRP
jgi:MFS family permease